jgi:predicted GNAT family N-acyltransferase
MAVLEDAARAENIAELTLHSRETVTGFYEKLGFHSEGDIFEEVGIPHRKMRKSL